MLPFFIALPLWLMQYFALGACTRQEVGPDGEIGRHFRLFGTLLKVDTYDVCKFNELSFSMCQLA